MFGFSRSTRLLTFLATAPLLAVILTAAGCTCGSGPYQGDYFDGDRPNSMKDVKFAESKKGDPKVIGCADGQREGFSDLAASPRIAACVGEWDGAKSLRDKPTGKACGDDGGKCAVPGDVCSPGWHVCGVGGKADDLETRTTQKDCDGAGPGRFNAALSHSPTDELDPCPRITKATTLPCVQAGIGAEPVCCGAGCQQGKCKDGVWKGKTRISRGTTEGCGAMTSERNGGILCCYDGDGAPTAAGGEAGAGAAEAGAADAKAEAGAAEAGAAEAKPEAGAAEAKAEAGAADAKAEAGAADAKPAAMKGSLKPAPAAKPAPAK